MTNTERNIERFLRSELCNKDIGKLVLKHASPGAKGNDVETFELTEAIPSEELSNFAILIVGRAQTDADGFGTGLHRYQVQTFYRDGEKASGRIVFRLKGSDDFDEDEAGEEAPTGKGLLQQLMRHNEANNRAMVGSTASLLNLMVRRMESQDRVLEKLLEERTKMFETLEAAKSQQHERDMGLMVEDAKQRRLDVGFQKISMLFPVVLDKLSGGKIPAQNDPTMMMLNELISSMNMEQFQAIQRTLSPEQQIVFMNVLQKFQESKKQLEGKKEN
jgi:hypothetical protein